MRKPSYLATGVVFLVSSTAGCGLLHAQAMPAMDEKAAITAFYDRFNGAFEKKDLDGVMASYAPDVFVFDVVPPREYPTFDAYKKDWEGLFKMFPGPLTNKISELSITVVGQIAYTHFILDGTFTAADGSQSHLVVRNTDVLRKSNGKWLIVQEHVSVPVDLVTGKPDLLSTP